MTQVEFVRYGSTTRREIKIQTQIQTSTLGFLHSRRQTALLETFTNNLNPPFQSSSCYSNRSRGKEHWEPLLNYSINRCSLELITTRAAPAWNGVSICLQNARGLSCTNPTSHLFLWNWRLSHYSQEDTGHSYMEPIRGRVNRLKI